MFDIELHEELRQELISRNAILGGGETLSELQQLLEEIEEESAAQNHISSFYSYWQWEAQSYPAKILPKSENGDPI